MRDNIEVVSRSVKTTDFNGLGWVKMKGVLEQLENEIKLITFIGYMEGGEEGGRMKLQPKK